jgi:hypothetical protein
MQKSWEESRTRVPMETLTTGPSSKWGRNVNRLGEVVDRCLLLRFPKDQELWVDEGGDLGNLVAQHIGVFLMSWRLKINKAGNPKSCWPRGIYSSPRKVAVSGRWRSLKPENTALGADNPAPNFCLCFLVLSRFQLFWGADNPVLGRIIRPPKNWQKQQY